MKILLTLGFILSGATFGQEHQMCRSNDPNYSDQYKEDYHCRVKKRAAEIEEGKELAKEICLDEKATPHDVYSERYIIVITPYRRAFNKALLSCLKEEWPNWQPATRHGGEVYPHGPKG